MFHLGRLEITGVYQNFFMLMNKIVGRDVLLSHSNFSEYLIICIDAIKSCSGE